MDSFVELDELFIEGLVPLTSLQDDRYFFRDTDRTSWVRRMGRVFRLGLRVRVLLDRIDRQQTAVTICAAAFGEERCGEGVGSLRGKKKKAAGERTERAGTFQPESLRQRKGEDEG